MAKSKGNIHVDILRLVPTCRVEVLGWSGLLEVTLKFLLDNPISWERAQNKSCFRRWRFILWLTFATVGNCDGKQHRNNMCTVEHT